MSDMTRCCRPHGALFQRRITGIGTLPNARPRFPPKQNIQQTDLNNVAESRSDTKSLEVFFVLSTRPGRAKTCEHTHIQAHLVDGVPLLYTDLLWSRTDLRGDKLLQISYRVVLVAFDPYLCRFASRGDKKTNQNPSCRVMSTERRKVYKCDPEDAPDKNVVCLATKHRGGISKLHSTMHVFPTIVTLIYHLL